jgi:hypothetical protein
MFTYASYIPWKEIIGVDIKLFTDADDAILEDTWLACIRIKVVLVELLAEVV